MAPTGTKIEMPISPRQMEAAAEAGIGADVTRPPNEMSEDAKVEISGEISREDRAPQTTRSMAQVVLIMSALCLSVFLAALDGTIIATALPTISEHFHSSAGYTWIGSSYLLGNAASVPTWGKFSDIWGRKPVLLAAAAIFFLGSLLCAVSVNIIMLIAGRTVQGVGCGGLIILVNICISDLFSMRNRATYFGIIGMVWALASAVGPVIGGVLTQLVSWRWCFYINLPCTAVGIIVIFFFLDLKTPKTPLGAGLKAIDWLGSVTIIGATLMFLLGLEFGGVTFPWNSPKVVCLIIFGFVMGGLFLINEWKLAKHPIMPLNLFKRTSNLAALGVCFSHGTVFMAGAWYLPLYFQAVHGATPLLSGVYIMPFVLTLSLVSGAVGVFIRKTGRYLEPIWFGMAFMTLGFGLFINLDVNSSWAKIIIFQILAGIGVGPNFQSPLIALQSLVESKDIATATATFGFTRNLATSISVVIGGVVFQNGMETRSTRLRASLGPATAAQLSGGTAGASVMIVQSLNPVQRNIARMAFAGSLKSMWILYACLAAAGLAASAFIGKHKLSKEHQETKTGLVSNNQAKRPNDDTRGNEKDNATEPTV